MSKEKQIIRPPALAGSWYDGDAETLRRRVTDFLNNAKITPLPDAFGFVVPHAGHRYSGQCAAYAYKAVSGRSFNRVILLGTNHQSYRFKGVAVTTMTHYQTPLGLVAVDTAACRKLLDKGGLFVTAPDAEASEHSLEIQLPFLQVALKEFKLVPLMVDGLSPKDYITASEAIKEIIDNQTLILASSDFTHYGQGFGYMPFNDNVKENLGKLDDGAIQEILSISPQGFLKYLADTEITICGYGPITLLLNLVPPGTTTTLLNYYTSGDLTGDFTHSVSYAAIGFSPDATVGTPLTLRKPKKDVSKPETENKSHELDESEQKAMLKLARETLRMYLKSGKSPTVDESTFTPRLKKEYGVFVSLHKDKQLRGCIGNFEPVTLYKAVIKQTVESATCDPRFEPMTASEETQTHIEISVMSPMRQVDSYKNIIVGTHGVYIRKGRHGATFLPQVAPEQGWDRDTMLEYLCEKAGLPADAYNDKDMNFYVYTAQVFGE